MDGGPGADRLAAWKRAFEDLEDTFDLFSGGRAVSENLWLDRDLGVLDNTAELKVPLDLLVMVTFGLQYTNMKKVTVDTYREDKYYPRVVRAFAKVLSHSDVVAPVEVLIEMGNLSKKQAIIEQSMPE